MYNNLFSDDKVDMKVLKERAVGMRWGSVPDGTIPLTAADPDFKPPIEIRQAMIEYIEGGYFPYSPSRGISGLRECIAEGLLKRKNEHIPPEYILPIDSAATALQGIAVSLLKPGDEAIIFDPVDLLFGISIRYAGATPVYFPSIYNDGKWDLSALEEYITPKTKMLCLCNPHNPMGYLFSKSELLYIATIAQKHDLWIMNDEIWSDIVYSEKPFVSINSLGNELNEKTISCYGFSKGFAMPGMRAGFIYALNENAFNAVSAVSSGTFGGVDVVTQVAMKAAFEKSFYWVDEFAKHLQANRDYIYERFLKMPLIKATKQEATFVTFPDISQTGLSSQEFVDYMSKEHGVVLVPGTVEWFGPRGEGHVRLCYSTSHGILKEALDRIEEGLIKLQNNNK